MIFHRSFFVTQISQMTQFFIHRITRNLVGGFLLRRLLTDWRRGDRFGRYRYPWDWNMSHRFHRYTQIFFIWIFHRSFCHADFADDADFYSSDHTEFSRRFPAEAITHGLTRRRPVRSIQIPLKAIRQRFHKKSAKSAWQKTIAVYIGRMPLARGQISSKIRE